MTREPQRSPSTEAGATPEKKGILAWMASNSVAANVLMLVLVIGGILRLQDIKQEVFPEFTLDVVVVQVPYPGATPIDVERSILELIEPELQGIDGVKRITSTALENYGVVTVELMLGTDANKAENEIRSAVSRVSLPQEAEAPTIAQPMNRFQVTSLVFYGDVSGDLGRRVLKGLAEQAKDDLERDSRITLVEIAGLPPSEISIEVPQAQLRKYGITIPQVAKLIEASSVEIPSGKVRTTGGDVQLRVDQKRRDGKSFREITLLSRPDGTRVTVADITSQPPGRVIDGFADTDQKATFNGKPAVMVQVFRVGSEKPLEVAAAVNEYKLRVQKLLPPGIDVEIWMDTSEMYKERVDLLTKNAIIGFILVLITIGLFLEVRLAFWVTMGIPISFIGALVFLPATGVSINMISLFAFIIVLGMVVDDAIIVGESIFSKREQGMGRLDAAIEGLKEVAAPVLFAVITTMIAYAPMLFVPGLMGKFFRVIPIVVIIVLFMSLVESLLILPAHLAHIKDKKKSSGIFQTIAKVQKRFAGGLHSLTQNYYKPFALKAVRLRYITLAISMAVLLTTCGLVSGGRVGWVFFPEIEDDLVIAYAEMAPGTPVNATKALQEKMIQSAVAIMEENGGVDTNSRGLYSQLGVSTVAASRQPDQTGRAPEGSHVTETAVYMKSFGKRGISPGRLATEWKKKIGDVPGLEKLRFILEAGPGSGQPVNIELRHSNMEVLQRAAEALGEKILEFDGIRDLDIGFTKGLPQINLKLKPQAKSMGLNQADVAMQVRGAFYGSEVLPRFQRGEDEVQTFVRLPKEERLSENNLDELIVRTPQGGEVALSSVADRVRARSSTKISRIDGDRALQVGADVDESIGSASEIMSSITKVVLPQLQEEFPGLLYGAGGDAKQEQETNSSLMIGFVMALVAMFALMAIAFRSYIQPLIIMIAIPFGIVGAIFGHMIMGYKLSLLSVMGIVALSGIVVNDSLILIVSVNRLREEGWSLYEAVVEGASRRVRPILLTSLTTFLGLAPMILETSMQARFLIPMAISLGFGVMFATMLTLLVVPAVYVIIEDIRASGRYFVQLFRSEDLVVSDSRGLPPTDL